MKIEAKSPEEYIQKAPKERQAALKQLREVIVSNLPKGFEEGMGYGMIAYFVPHSIYPDGYHCDPKTPLPFMNLASQKNFIGFYHMGIYSDEALKNWFIEEYAKACKSKLDMGKSCIRLKKMEEIPYELIGKLVKKMTVKGWIQLYENRWKR